ncbi:SEC14-like protein 1 isoform X2 [Chrysoperla carnea]|uniref:SEC14-like protein 1 isoform X2 n=1 Tax=Chrysoperla carnea TaxID=189513 RepID=UPI001D06C58F|nr:SEC14-like protein 1 isoform X2 [Chrysoperla carnea]
MVQQYQSPLRVYKYPFELVMAAYERRFPTCPHVPDLLDSTITEDEESEDKSFHTVVRRCKINVEAPYLVKKIVGVDCVYFIQKNMLNRRERVLEIDAYNESFATRVIINEKCRYFVHPENADWTCFEQNASLDIKNFFGFENTVEKIGMKQYSQTVAKGKEIIEFYIKQLADEGITHIPIWVPPDSPGNGEVENGLTSSENSNDLQLGASASNLISPQNGATNNKHSGGKSVQFQLEADYIQRYLGELTVLQESRLVQLRTWVAELLKGKVPNDTTLLRFLRARDFNVEKAREMLSHSLVWRKKYQVDKILSEYELPKVVVDYFPGGWHHQDKVGRPLYILRLGQMDVKGLLKSIGEEGLLKLTLHVCEEGLRQMDEATRVLGKPISTWTLLVDLEGLNMRHLWRPGIKALLRIIEIVEANYPETMGRVLIIRAPRVFPILWTLVSTFIDENTRTKFLFYGGNDYLQPNGGLIDYIPESVVPDFLGGPCKTKVHEGGLIPKSLYLPDPTWMDKEGGLSQDSLYHSATLGKGQVHEVLVDNEDPGSVLTWDFDVVRQDVAFTVYRTSVPIQEIANHNHTNSLQKSHSFSESEQHHRSVIEKTWKENQDYYKVEPTLVCHDGESTQGSHVMAYCGTYILQWKFYCGHQHDLIDTFTSHKAQIMYFYEKLRSADYRGSMTSLQSGHSGFSALSTRSLASSCPSR